MHFRSDYRGEAPDPCSRSGEMQQVRNLLRGLPRPLRRGNEAYGRARSGTCPGRAENCSQKEKSKERSNGRSKMSEISLQIDGRTVAAREDMTLLVATQISGLSIPTVCHHEKLEPFGGCRLCMVG